MMTNRTKKIPNGPINMQHQNNFPIHNGTAARERPAKSNHNNPFICIILFSPKKNNFGYLAHFILNYRLRLSFSFSGDFDIDFFS